MANYFTQFSQNLSGITVEERAWIESRLASNNEDEDKENWPDFDWSFHEDRLWIRSEGSGNIDNVCVFVKEFLKKFRPRGSWTMTWASTCDKLRVDGFSGGAVFVTAKGDKAIEASTWTHQQTKNFETRSKKSRTDRG